jgi:phosphopantothenoylcysteine decarboxylase / phosphopantothenate---cysteine ligase
MGISATSESCGESSRPRRIVLGVTGGIAAYKSPDLVRRLKEQGAQVQVVMSAGAREFVTPLTFQAVSGLPVRSDLWDHAAEAAMGHIELARWADEVLIAPATADFIAHFAHGFANDLLTTLCLATRAPISIAPAMNQAMWTNAATQANIELLKSRCVRVLGPASGEQACGEVGEGRMLEPLQLASMLAPRTRGKLLAGIKAVVTAGPTRERLDPVRFITNRSSGKMGYAIAEALWSEGAEVVLVSGPVSLPAPPDLPCVKVESAEQMLAAVQANLHGAQLFVSTAAVSDYRAAEMCCEKIKKTCADVSLQLVRTPDILATVSTQEYPLGDRPFVVGFAAETNDVERHALTKLNNKKLDMIAANQVGDGLGFDKDDNALTVYWPGGQQVLSLCSKRDLAAQLVKLIAERYRAQHSN